MPLKWLITPAFFLVLAASGCSISDSGSDAVQVISREAFIEAYVELRIAAHRRLDQEVSLEERDRILQELGLTPEDLLTFVEVHGEDPRFMFEVWEEVDARFREIQRGERQPSGEDPAGMPGGDPGRPGGE